MKKLALLFVVLGLAACSSSAKKQAATPAKSSTTGTLVTPAKPAADAKKADAKKAATPKATATKATTEAAAGSTTASTCTFGDTRRELRVLKTAGRCSVEYVKDGETKEIASGQEDSAVCGEVFQRVKNNLTTAGYECN